nr:hypothetical protein [Sicyoidochytrium minutum DNA virus]
MVMMTIAIFMAIFASYQLCWFIHDFVDFLLKFFKVKGSYLDNRQMFAVRTSPIWRQNEILRSTYTANIISFLHALFLCEATSYIYLGRFTTPFSPAEFGLTLLSDFDDTTCVVPSNHADVNLLCSISAGYFLYDAVRMLDIEGLEWGKISDHTREYLFHHLMAFILVFIGAITPGSIWFAPMIPYFLFMEASTIHLTALIMLLGVPQMPFARFTDGDIQVRNAIAGFLTALFSTEFLAVRIVIYWSKVVTFFVRHAVQTITLNSMLVLLCVVLPVGVLQLIWGSRIAGFAFKKIKMAVVSFRELSHSMLGTRLDQQLASE